MNRDILLLFVGAGIALMSSLVTALVQHLLSIRIEKIKKALEKREKEDQELKGRLIEGAQVYSDFARKSVLAELEKEGGKRDLRDYKKGIREGLGLRAEYTLLEGESIEVILNRLLEELNQEIQVMEKALLHKREERTDLQRIIKDAKEETNREQTKPDAKPK